jgi:hypothetical protein
LAAWCWLAAILLAIAWAACPRKAPADDVFWNFSGGEADWNTALNWNPARVPTGTDNAIFNNSGTADFSTNVTDTLGDIRFGDTSAGVGPFLGGGVNQSNGTIDALALRMSMSDVDSMYNLSGGTANRLRGWFQRHTPLAGCRPAREPDGTLDSGSNRRSGDENIEEESVPTRSHKTRPAVTVCMKRDFDTRATRN